MTTAKCVLLFALMTGAAYADYWGDREKFIRSERSRAIGADIVLTDKERAVNDILMNYKLRELDEGLLNPGQFLAAQHFFHSKPG